MKIHHEDCPHIITTYLSSLVQQSSLYELAGVLPISHWYTQAIMVGESTAGMTVAIIHAILKASTADERTGAIAFFIISLVFILVCVGCQVFLRLSPLSYDQIRAAATRKVQKY